VGLDWSRQRLRPRLPWTKYGRDKLWLVGCLGSEVRLAVSHTGGMLRLSGALGEASCLRGGSAGRAPTLHRIPWHLPYNWGKSRKTSVRVTEWRSAVSPGRRCLGSLHASERHAAATQRAVWVRLLFTPTVRPNKPPGLLQMSMSSERCPYVSDASVTMVNWITVTYALRVVQKPVFAIHGTRSLSSSVVRNGACRHFQLSLQPLPPPPNGDLVHVFVCGRCNRNMRKSGHGGSASILSSTNCRLIRGSLLSIAPLLNTEMTLMLHIA